MLRLAGLLFQFNGLGTFHYCRSLRVPAVGPSSVTPL